MDYIEGHFFYFYFLIKDLSKTVSCGFCFLTLFW